MRFIHVGPHPLESIKKRSDNPQYMGHSNTLFYLPLRSLQAPAVLYFALFFCRGKQLDDGQETGDRQGSLIERRSEGLMAISGPTFSHLILSNARSHCPPNHKGLRLVCSDAASAAVRADDCAPRT